MLLINHFFPTVLLSWLIRPQGKQNIKKFQVCLSFDFSHKCSLCVALLSIFPTHSVGNQSPDSGPLSLCLILNITDAKYQSERGGLVAWGKKSQGGHFHLFCSLMSGRVSSQWLLQQCSFFLPLLKQTLRNEH